ncbi:MAG: nicotinate (nicotinamide) nucleotide adenylyltransferase [Candidatus Cloacimonadaceae bacterium]
MVDIAALKGAWAIFGGSFDPIHNGHLQLAKEVLSLNPINKVIMVPSFHHNFKGDKLVLDYDSRLALVKEAIDSYYPLEFLIQPAEDYRCPIEVWDSERGESGYTADLIRKLANEYPKQHFAFVLGADNLEQLHEWHDYEWLRENLHFIILPRPEAIMPCDILSSISHIIMDIPLCEISASEIRRRIAAGESIHGLVPEGIEAKVIELYSK